ncbi:MAG: excinuclease ABC subunit UvrA [Elusimicrobiales bacterium]|nr:excinuclease ABC subunit UvrA [Elusimicrobiales bacterium]
MNSIIIKGARTHNLKNINLEIPKNKIIVITGLSGSGKSSLAFDTIYAEGQRRYVESLSAYARQFLELMEKPDVDLIEGLSPSIAIEQRSFSKNPRSTVGTITEIYDYLRLLFAKIGIPHCPQCKRSLKAWSIDAIIEDIVKKFYNKKIVITSPLIRGKIGTYDELFERFKKKGYSNFEVDGNFYKVEKIPSLERYKKHDISIVIDSFNVSDDKERLFESVELALKESNGMCEIIYDKNRYIYSQKNSCPYCNISIGNIEPRTFSFNSPFGACPKCEGLGFVLEVDVSLIINENLTIDEGAIVAWENPITTKTNRWKTSWRNYYRDIIIKICEKYNIKTNIPFKKLSEKEKRIILYGDLEFEGVINNIKRRYQETESDFVKQEIYSRYMKEILCDECGGKRLKRESLSVLINGKNISEICDMDIVNIINFFKNINLTDQEKEISKNILNEINSRLEFLMNVGLGYLNLSRYSKTLSGGEAQRISLATQIGSRLTGVIYVLDEPTIGLHPIDNLKLINTLKKLRDFGNTLIVVEHDRTTIENADYIIELGPGAGIYGGEVTFCGTFKELKKANTITALYIKDEEKVSIIKDYPRKFKKFIEIKGARQYNLKNINVKIPIGSMTVICGVSGSGKSTLLYEILYKGIMKKINPSFKEEPGIFDSIKGYEDIKRVVMVDQSPIGRTPRSNPATYVGFFDNIRYLFSQTPAAKRKGYKASRFSFNLSGGRCENCKGEGYIKVEMQFMPDVYVKCQECEGRRFNKETLEVKYKEKNIAEVLDMTIEEAYNFFENIFPIKQKLKFLIDVGLGYLKIGQNATTLSGGEAQRIKLAWELLRKNSKSTLYILDEPTTGLHFHDIKRLLNILKLLVANGNTVVIIEHNIDVIKSADWIIELGPEGGPNGGYVIYEGFSENIKKAKKSITKNFLK